MILLSAFSDSLDELCDRRLAEIFVVVFVGRRLILFGLGNVVVVIVVGIGILLNKFL